MRLYLNQSEYILTEEGVDLSIPVKTGNSNVNAWYCSPVSIEPVVAINFVGDVNQGGSVNFKNITLNPHGNGTHTECVGHISSEVFTINQCLKEFHFMARLISVNPDEVWDEEYQANDQQINMQHIQHETNGWDGQEALIIRTVENGEEKITHQYSGTNPPYFTGEAIRYINSLGVKHLMVDLPSVDRENDNGALVCHKAFWNYPENPLTDKTISELLYIPNDLKDGTYLVQIQIMSIESDASPSKIVAHKIHMV